MKIEYRVPVDVPELAERQAAARRQSTDASLDYGAVFRNTTGPGRISLEGYAESQLSRLVSVALETVAWVPKDHRNL